MKTNLSLSSLLLNLISRAPKAPVANQEPEESKKVGTTIRFEPATRRFIEAQADHLGISVQEFVAMTFKAIMSATEEPQATELELMADRFVDSFTRHGIAIADIPAMLPEGAINRADLLSRKELLNKLDDRAIKQVSELFTLNPDWLKGVYSNPHDTPFSRWYKNVSGFARRLAILNHKCRRIRVLFTADKDLTLEALLEAKEKGDDVAAVDIGVVIEKENLVNGVEYKSYEVWESERWNYWRCRYCLKAIMMFCEKAGVDYDGLLLEPDAKRSLFYGDAMAADEIKQYREIWYPDQLLWGDDRNLERDELPSIKRFYEESKAGKYEIIVKQPYVIKDWDEFERGRFDFSTISQ
jgi:hypothetical protein